MDLVRVIIIEVGSTGFVLVLVLVRGRGGVKGPIVVASFIAASSFFLSALHFLYLSAAIMQKFRGEISHKIKVEHNQ